MIAIARFRVPAASVPQFSLDAEAALAALAACDGFIQGEFGQNTDEADLWALATIWKNVGSYRRALSNNRVKMEAVPMLALAIDEPGAYTR